MKKALMYISATTAVYAAVVYGLMYFQYLFILTRPDVVQILQQFNMIQNLLMLCRQGA